MSDVKEELSRREAVRGIVLDACRELIHPIKRVRVGLVHQYIATRLGVLSNTWLKSITNEFLKEAGIKRVMIHGYPYFRVNP